MSHAVLLHPAARQEVEDAALWYGRHSPGLDAAFLAEVDRAIGLARQSPMQFAVVHDDVRRVRLRRFPYSVFYRPEERHIFVVAVFHASRSPVIWQHRE